jgi:prepilin peptidase CpaA
MAADFHMVGQVAVVSFPLVMTVAGAMDVMTRRIPNGLCVFLALIFFPFALSTGMPPVFIGLHLVTAAVLLLIGYGLFVFGLVGGGDAKLLAAAGLWLGFPSVLPFVVFTALAGGVLAGCIGLWFVVNIEAGMRSEALNRILAPLAPDVPYGFALAAGAILTVPFTWWMAVASAPT